MGFFRKVMAKSETVDLEEVLNNMDQIEEESYENADAFVKPLDLIVDADATAVINEAKAGNIVLVNIADLKKRNATKLRELIADIKAEIKKIDGDIAAISQERLLVTPAKVKIIKKK
ncbi:MAG: cell division protein SepF [Candidatus Diapherotrites archaeon]|uniref:Cell division protein SepF n=1 Tax=Candidatus Iainarchaeum sp. TaxID=3101447 RepID=A0A7K4BZE6_9ARCH|nr:cell division protein SepF [Candidatus Diapherotrites archaeon]